MAMMNYKVESCNLMGIQTRDVGVASPYGLGEVQGNNNTHFRNVVTHIQSITQLQSLMGLSVLSN